MANFCMLQYGLGESKHVGNAVYLDRSPLASPVYPAGKECDDNVRRRAR